MRHGENRGAFFDSLGNACSGGTATGRALFNLSFSRGRTNPPAKGPAAFYTGCCPEQPAPCISQQASSNLDWRAQPSPRFLQPPSLGEQVVRAAAASVGSRLAHPQSLEIGRKERFTCIDTRNSGRGAAHEGGRACAVARAPAAASPRRLTLP